MNALSKRGIHPIMIMLHSILRHSAFPLLESTVQQSEGTTRDQAIQEQSEELREIIVHRSVAGEILEVSDATAEGSNR